MAVGSALWRARPPRRVAATKAAREALLRQQPTSPPPGKYDPAIDAQVGQAGRGLKDLLDEYVQNYGEPATGLGGRAGEDYGTAKQQAFQSYSQGLADVGRGSGRSLADLLTARTRAGEDYASNIAGVQRGFAQLGAQQGQAARAAGVQRGGALAQALAKRSSNEAIARAPIDTGYQRFGADSALAESRLGEDRTLAEERLKLGAGDTRTALDRGFLRGAEDAAQKLVRGAREAVQFGLDANAQRLYQANTVLPGPPKPAAGKKKAPPKRRGR